MEVILLETFDRLGKIGDVVKVKDGFARNFLIPQKKALRANDTNKDYFAKIKNDLLEKSKKAVDEANLILKKIENKDIIFIRNASDNGQLYGSVSPKDISNYFGEQKVDIKPSSINLYTPIKKIGIYDFFEYVAGHNTFDYCKPDPRHLTSVVEILDGDLKKSLMIGDSETDANAAKDAGMPVILLEDGYTEKNTTEIYHNHLVKDFQGIEKIVSKYL